MDDFGFACATAKVKLRGAQDKMTQLFIKKAEDQTVDPGG